MPAFTIRSYRPEDLPRICAITIEGFDGVSIDRNIETHFGPVGGHDWAARKARSVEFDCSMQPDGIFIAEADGIVVGYITTYLDEHARIGRIPNLAVAATHREHGIATALIRHAVDWMRGRGMAMAKIETLEQNARGQSLYPKLGFVEVARQIHYVMPLSQPEKPRA
jgi:ribosomal protein S18 acetylase RimI-like enzyme